MKPDLGLGPTSGDWVGALTSPEVYQAAVKKLTAQNKNLAHQLAELRQQHQQEVNALRAQLLEGITPEIIQLKRSVSHWRTRAQVAEARLRENRKVGNHGQR